MSRATVTPRMDGGRRRHRRNGGARSGQSTERGSSHQRSGRHRRFSTRGLEHFACGGDEPADHQRDFDRFCPERAIEHRPNLLGDARGGLFHRRWGHLDGLRGHAARRPADDCDFFGRITLRARSQQRYALLLNGPRNHLDGSGRRARQRGGPRRPGECARALRVGFHHGHALRQPRRGRDLLPGRKRPLERLAIGLAGRGGRPLAGHDERLVSLDGQRRQLRRRGHRAASLCHGIRRS